MLKSLLALTGLLASPAAFAEAPLREPTGKWIVDYADSVCTATRSYGGARGQTSLALRPSPGGTVVRLIVARPGKGPEAYHFPVTTTVTSDMLKTTGLRFTPAKSNIELIWINFERTALDGLTSAGEIAIKASGVIDERFALPGIGAVLKALDTCNADLRRHWNAGEPAAEIATPARPVKPLHKLISHRDYPAQALREDQSGITGFVLMIDETGTPKNCMVEATSGIASLDAMTCGVLLGRAKFSPALDAAGKPVKSVYHQRVRWVSP